MGGQADGQDASPRTTGPASALANPKVDARVNGAHRANEDCSRLNGLARGTLRNIGRFAGGGDDPQAQTALERTARSQGRDPMTEEGAVGSVG